MLINLKKTATVSLIILSILSSCSKNTVPQKAVSSRSNQVALQWNELAYHAFGGTSYQHSLMASRINAMMHLAMHDALNAIESKYSRYAFNGHDAGADPIAASVTAAHDVLVNEIPEKKSFIDSAWEFTMSTVPGGLAKEKGIALGKLAAQAVLNKRVNDGASGDVFGQIPPSTTPGVYQAVPPFNFVFAPHWEDLKLFSLDRKDQFRPLPPPSITSETYTKDFNEVKTNGMLNSTTRSANQTAYAKFWYEFSEAGWNRVARVVASVKNLNLLETVRLFALVDMAIADAYTAGWDAKMYYNFWRPYTAIRNASTDNNDLTNADPEWESSEPTPPVQDYPSTHSALGNAGATVLARILGDNFSFMLTSPTAVPAGSSRSFTSFSQAANENADSRVQAGIHFRFSCKAGQELGNEIGNWTVDKHLKPL